MKEEDFLICDETIWESPSITLHAEEEMIAGVEFVVRSTAEVTMQLQKYCTYDKQNSLKQETALAHESGIFTYTCSQIGQPQYFECFLKKGTERLVFFLRFCGKASVSITNLQIIDAEQRNQPQLPGAPYLGLIRSLQANPDWEIHKTVQCQESPMLSEQLAPYMQLSPKQLYDLMPMRRPFRFDIEYGKLTFNELYEQKWLWSPLEPEVIRKQDGTVFDFLSEYPITGYEEVVLQDGSTDRYPYHDFVESLSDPDKGAMPKERIYLDFFLTSSKLNSLTEACLGLAEYYAASGNQEAGIRSAAILYALSCSIRRWPIHGCLEWWVPQEKFFPPDSYDLWRTFLYGYWYTACYNSGIDRFVDPYVLINQAQLWKQIDPVFKVDTRKTVTDTVLFITRLCLKYDAYHRLDPWKFYHNTIGLQLEGYFKAGRAIGCPELIHYAANKAFGAVRYNYMADGMFPESVSYVHDLTDGITRAFCIVIGYEDPEGFVSVQDGRHYSNFLPEEESELYARALKLMGKLYFPDGSLLTVHDTWATSVTGTPPATSRKSTPYLLPGFGHAASGFGTGQEAVETHLHYSADYNHGHQDMLNLILWGYGKELISDIGYTHLGGYALNTVSHNLVMVDEQEQCKTECGDLTAFFADSDHIHIMQARDCGQAYPQTTLYQRQLICIKAKNCCFTVDIFEIEGGSQHDWMANGCADIAQQAFSDAPVQRTKVNLGDGSPFEKPQMVSWGSCPQPGLPCDKTGEKSSYFNAFQNVKILEQEDVTRIWLQPQEEEDSSWLYLHWLNTTDAELMLCDVPRMRYPNELDHLPEAYATWEKRTMPKVVARKSGRNLSSTFCGVWEPAKKDHSNLTVNRIQEIPIQCGVGFSIKTDEQEEYHILYQKRGNGGIRFAEMGADADFLVLKKTGDSASVMVFGGTWFEWQGQIYQIDHFEDCSVETTGTDEKGSYVLLSKGVCGLEGLQPGYVRVCQENQSSRWLSVQSVGCDVNGRIKLYTDQLDFSYESSTQLLRETYNPYRTLKGTCKIEFPYNSEFTMCNEPGARNTGTKNCFVRIKEKATYE